MERDLPKFLHSMIRVSDVDKTIAFFDLLGLKEVKRFDSEHGRFSLVYLAAPGDEGATPRASTFRVALPNTQLNVGAAKPAEPSLFAAFPPGVRLCDNLTGSNLHPLQGEG